MNEIKLLQVFARLELIMSACEYYFYDAYFTFEQHTNINTLSYSTLI